MNNPISSAFSSIGQNLTNIGNGSNPLFAPQVAQLFGFNVAGIPLISARDVFLTQMESWFTAIPTDSQWIVLINQYPTCINTAVLQGLERTDGSRKGFDVNQAFKILTAFPLQKITGCLFAQSVNLPQESFGVDYVHIENSRGFTPGLISKERESPSQLNIDFLETNTSFADFVIRPWIIAGSHFGFVTRNPKISTEAQKNVKTTVQVLQYTRTVQNVSMIPRKIWTFYNCAPVYIDGGSLDYQSQTSPTNISTRWAYSHYTVENNLYFPLTSIINRVSTGKFPNVSQVSQSLQNFNPAGLF
jgi:hypothetical protein